MIQLTWLSKKESSYHRALKEKNTWNLDELKKIKKYKKINEEIIDMMWRLKFNIYTNGSTYLSTALLLCFIDDSFLKDTNQLITVLAKIYEKNEKNIRNSIDNTLNSAFKLDDIPYTMAFFEGYYDGRKISFKYFLHLVTYYISRKMK